MREAKKEFLRTLAEQLSAKGAFQVKALIGFDGFVDEVVHVVGKRYDAQQYERIEYMEEYGSLIAKAGGLSLNVEMLPIRRKIGGNGTILANSLLKLGFYSTYIGACGKERIDPVFEELDQYGEIISISDPGKTDAIEFRDGKIISCKLEALKDVCWRNIKETVGVENLARRIEASDVLGFVNWTLLINMSDIWEHILEEVLPLVKNRTRKTLFIDLADPAKRAHEDILHAINLLEQFENVFDVILGLNRKEACMVAELLSHGEEAVPKKLLDIAVYLKERISVSKIVIHTAKEACAVSAEGTATVESPYCGNPRQTTGAGDSFNAGFIFGQMLGRSLEESLALGIANAGYYIREASNANFSEILNFLHMWSEEKLDVQ